MGQDRLTDEERNELKPQKDEFGALEKFLVGTTSRKENLLGRPSVYSEHGYAPFKEYLINGTGRITGRIGHGAFRDAIRVSAKAEQVVDAPFEQYACTFAPDDHRNQSSDILYLDCWITNRGAEEHLLHGHKEAPWLLLFSPAGNRLVSCSDDGSMRLWDVAKLGRPGPNFAQEINNFPCYRRDNSGKVTRGNFVAFSPYGRWLATVYEHKVSLRSPKDGNEVVSWEPDSPMLQRIMALRFDPLGNTLLAFLENAKLTTSSKTKFWKYDIDHRDAWPFEGKHGVVDGRATADGKYVITWDGSPEIVFWDIKEHTETAALKVTPEHVYDVAFSPMGDVVATAGDDGEVKFWKVADRTQLTTKNRYKHNGIDYLRFVNDGKGLVTGSDDGWIKVWNTPEFFWNRHLPGFWSSTSAEGVTEQSWSDSTTITDPDGFVMQTFPDGTVKKFRQQ
jgi:WD40 repeat protein